MEQNKVAGPEPDNNQPVVSQPSQVVGADSAPQEPAPLDGAQATPIQQPVSVAQEPAPEPAVQDEPTALVRYGRMNMLGEFRRPDNVTFSAGEKVVVRTERGIEVGRVVLGYYEGCGERGVSRGKWHSYLEKCGPDYPISRQGNILRRASQQDLLDQQHLDQNAAEKLRLCQKLAIGMGLSMKMVDVEHLFGGDRILFYFKSEKRVDFRRLVRRLAKEYQTRIEMRQVGARDEAKLLADYERCGQECCCKSFLKLLAPVNMRMAKVQKATLDPAKISGRCGRLMCCLRYEHFNYEQLRKTLPARNTPVKTPEGEGLVVDRQILTQLVVVSLADGKRVAFPLSEITILSGKNGQGPAPEQDEDDMGSEDSSPEQQDSRLEATQAGDGLSDQRKRRRKKKRGRSNRPREAGN